MEQSKAIVILNLLKRNEKYDIEIPLDITATELIVGLNSAYKLGIDTNDVKQCFLKTENPIALLRGSKTLAQYGIRNGSIINFS